MKKLAGKNRGKLIDLLVERLVFEKTGVDLYTALLERLGGSGDRMLESSLTTLARIRREEAEHQAWLEEKVQELGGNPLVPSHLSSLSRAEASGIEQIVLRERSSPEDMVHAILLAELLDHAGWNLLVQLASEAHDDEAMLQFRKRLLEENDHLGFLRTLVTACARRMLTGEATDVTRKAA